MFQVFGSRYDSPSRLALVHFSPPQDADVLYDWENQGRPNPKDRDKSPSQINDRDTADAREGQNRYNRANGLLNRVISNPSDRLGPPFAAKSVLISD